MVDDTIQVPPRTGPGATVEAWEEYARLAGVEHPSGATRDEIQEAVDNAHPADPEVGPPTPEEAPEDGAAGVAGDAPAPDSADDDEEDGDADDVPDEETPEGTETPAAQEEADEAEEAAEGVTFVVEGQKAPDFARAPNRPKTELVVRLGGRTVQFRGGRLTTSNPTVINALDRLAEQHSDGKVVEITRQTPDGEEKFFKWDAHYDVREAGRPGYDGPPRNTYGVKRLEA